MSSAVDICNEALALIGIETAIERMDDDTRYARGCARFYPQARLFCLEAGSWRFAKAEAPLAGAVNAKGKWIATLPGDCCRVIDVAPEDVDWIMGADGLTFDEAVADGTLIYVSSACAEQKFSASFVEFLKHHLAAQLAPYLSRPIDVASYHNKRAAERMVAALGRDGIQSRRRQPPMVRSSWLDARRPGSRSYNGRVTP